MDANHRVIDSITDEPLVVFKGAVPREGESLFINTVRYSVICVEWRMPDITYDSPETSSAEVYVIRCDSVPYKWKRHVV